LEQSRILTTLAAAALVCTTLAPAVAASPGNAVKSFGLVGTWSWNCAVSEETAGANRMTFAAPENGPVTFTTTFTLPPPGNPQASVFFQIDEATPLSGQRIKLIGKITKQSRTDRQDAGPPDGSPRQIIIEKSSGQIRIIENRLLDGTSVNIDAGIVRATGKPAASASKCGSRG
jgi:hypothetical protein